MHLARLCLFVLTIGRISINGFSQDTLKINLDQADRIFFENNYYLLASALNIDAKAAQVLQSKLYPNPIFTADLNAFDPENNKLVHIGASGQKAFQLDQLILLGGKRKSEIELAKTNVQLAELEFQKLVRELKFRLHRSLFTVGQQKDLLNRYNYQLKLLDDLLSAYQIQVEKGSLPLKDLVRLKGAYLKLNNDRAELLKDYFKVQADLQTLFQNRAIVDFQFDDQQIDQYIKVYQFSEIEEEALLNRPELLLIQKNKLFAEQYFRYQKQLAIPDLNVMVSYDQRGGAYINQINAGVSLPLSLWNRNQGNIKQAQVMVKEAETNELAAKNELISALQGSYGYYLQTIAEYKKAKNLYNKDFDITVKGMVDNFQKQNVSIIEFVDFFEAYNEVLTEIARVKIQLVTSGEELNLLIGKDLY